MRLLRTEEREREREREREGGRGKRHSGKKARSPSCVFFDNTMKSTWPESVRGKEKEKLFCPFFLAASVSVCASLSLSLFSSPFVLAFRTKEKAIPNRFPSVSDFLRVEKKEKKIRGGRSRKEKTYHESNQIFEETKDNSRTYVPRLGKKRNIVYHDPDAFIYRSEECLHTYRGRLWINFSYVRLAH